MLFIDATFKCIPKTFYQTLNISAYIDNKNLSIPIISVLMKFKNEDSYIIIFENIKILLHNRNIKVKFEKLKIIDFEKTLRNEIKYSFPKSIILGCYFHCIKCKIKKLKELGLLKNATSIFI